MDPNTNSAVWFSQAKSDKVLFDSSGLVLERFEGSPGGVPGYSWLGDQGLFLYGCFRNADPKASNLNSDQVDATINAVFGNRTADNDVLSEKLFPDASFYLDYAGGKGIFMRYLGFLNYDRHNMQLGGTTYDSKIMANASAVWNNKTSDGYFHYWWEKQTDSAIDWGYPQDVVNNVLHASGLSALTACCWGSSMVNNEISPT